MDPSLQSILRRSAKIPAIFITVWVGMALLLRAGPVAEGVRSGLTVCTAVVIPSLFPFLVLSGFLSLSQAGSWLARPLEPLCRRLFRLPGPLGTVFLLSLTGGYPVGARAISSLLRQNRIDRDTASRMLCFCVNAGPSFLISTIGWSLWGSPRFGLVLLAAQTASAVILALILSRGAPMPRVKGESHGLSLPAAFVEAVTGGAAGMLRICAFVLTFSVVTVLLRESGLLNAAAELLTRLLAFPLYEPFYSALFTGLLEVTGGALAAAELGGMEGFLLTAFLTGFGGLSVLCQTAAFFPSGSVELRPFLLSRLTQGLLTAVFAWPLWNRFCRTLMTSCQGTPVMVVSPQSVLISLCLLAMCSILLLGLSVRPGTQ